MGVQVGVYFDRGTPPPQWVYRFIYIDGFSLVLKLVSSPSPLQRPSERPLCHGFDQSISTQNVAF